MRIRTMKVVVAVMASLALAIAACGTTDEAGTDDTTTTEAGDSTTTEESTTTTEEETTTTEEETTTTTEPDDEDAAARARAALLAPEDFPAEFKISRGDNDDSDDEIQECAPELDIPGETVAEAESNDFTKGDLDAADGTQYSADSAVLSSEDVATEIVDLFGDDAFADCVTQVLKEELAPAEATGDLEALSDLDVGEQAAGLQGALTLSNPDTGEELVLDIAVAAIRTGDLVTVLGAIGLNQILDQDLIAELADTIASRQEG